MPRKPTTIDAYLAGVTGERRTALEALRRTIRSMVPEAEECISYGLPAFRLDGDVVGGFAATAGGCSYYPFSGRTLGTLAGDLAGRSRTRSALHFGPARGLPKALVRKLLRARIAEIRGEPGPAPSPTSSSTRAPQHGGSDGRAPRPGRAREPTRPNLAVRKGRGGQPVRRSQSSRRKP
jgi:uncharacterized protein YdhG (YjbR/CyaY superfamily)